MARIPRGLKDRSTGRTTAEGMWTVNTERRNCKFFIHAHSHKMVDGKNFCLLAKKFVNVVPYRRELDGKYWADIDNSGRYGVPFSSYDKMRESIKPEFELVEMSRGILDPSKEAAVKALCNNAPQGAYVCINDMKLYDWKVVTDPKTGVTLCPDCASDVTPAAFWDDAVQKNK